MDRGISRPEWKEKQLSGVTEWVTSVEKYCWTELIWWSWKMQNLEVWLINEVLHGQCAVKENAAAFDKVREQDCGTVKLKGVDGNELIEFTSPLCHFCFWTESVPHYLQGHARHCVGSCSSASLLASPCSLGCLLAGSKLLPQSSNKCATHNLGTCHNDLYQILGLERQREKKKKKKVNCVTSSCKETKLVP